jgi:hypothetical protein
VANRPGVGHHQKYESDTKLLVCLLVRSYRIDRAFCQMRWIRQVPLALSPNPTTQHRGHGRGAATDALAHRRLSAFAPHRGLKDRFLPCTTNTLVKPRHGPRFAQAALKLCGTLEQHRDLGTCPMFMSLNAELVACCTLRPWKSRQHDRVHRRTRS